MDLRTQASLIAALLCGALAANVVLRSRTRKVHWAFGFFALSVALWYLSGFARRVLDGSVWQQLNLVCGVLVPVAAMQFFRHFSPETDRRMVVLNRVALGTGVVVIGAILSPEHDHILVGSATFLYTLVFFFASLVLLYDRVRHTPSRFERARLRYLVLVGCLGGIFTLLEYAPYVGLEIPPVGTVLILAFLYMLSQSITRYRLIDLYELTGRLGVLTALSFMLATILWGLVRLTGERAYLHSVISAVVVLLLFDPIRAKVGNWISQVFFRDRYDFESRVASLRRRVGHHFEVDDLCRVVLSGLEETRRVTHASLYMAGPDRRGFNLAGHLGPEPPQRIDMAPARPLLDRLVRDGPLVLENLERELADLRDGGEDREAETLFEVIQALEVLHADLCLPFASEQGELYGFMVMRDERVRDAFAPEEVQLLVGLATQIAITLEGSKLYHQMKERDRLAALGEMAAGLAHEIRNPLGAIKASAQYLSEPGQPQNLGDEEFLDIIVEETDRLDRVVGSFLDFARPSQGNAVPTDVEHAVRRTLQLLGPELDADRITWSIAVDEDLPRVKVDIEQLRQVLINLVKNAVQAMPDGGEVRIQLAHRLKESIDGESRPWLELRVTDTGEGIPHEMLPRLFLPFVTSKQRGTGLGLAISQRIVHASGGHIEVRTHEGVGTTFVVHLPGVDEGYAGNTGLYSESDGRPPPSIRPGAPAGDASEEASASAVVSPPADSEASRNAPSSLGPGLPRGADLESR